MKKFLIGLLTLAMLLSMTAGAFATSDEGYVRIVGLEVNNMTDPLGLDEAPIFGWKMDSNIIGAQQEAYQIVVKNANGDVVWELNVFWWII